MCSVRCILLFVSVFWAADSVIGSSTPFQVISAAENTLAVVNIHSGDTLFRLAKPEGVLREMAALDDGHVVMTTTADASEFRDAETGRLLRRYDERIYAYSSDQRMCVAFSREHDLLLLDFPELTVRFVLLQHSAWGPSTLLFSPDDRYLAVEFCNHYPLSDVLFLDPVFDKTDYHTLLFDLESGERLPDAGGTRLGRFAGEAAIYIADDGRSYDLTGRMWLSLPQR